MTSFASRRRAVPRRDGGAVVFAPSSARRRNFGASRPFAGTSDETFAASKRVLEWRFRPRALFRDRTRLRPRRGRPLGDVETALRSACFSVRRHGVFAFLFSGTLNRGSVKRNVFTDDSTDFVFVSAVYGQSRCVHNVTDVLRRDGLAERSVLARVKKVNK